MGIFKGGVALALILTCEVVLRISESILLTDTLWTSEVIRRLG